MMTGVEMVRAAAVGPARMRPRAAGGEGFRVPATGGQVMPGGALAASLPMAGIGAAMPSMRDMAARRRAGALLGGLTALQREMLGGTPDSAVLARLPDLLDGEDGEDPALAELLQGLALRARIELLRRERSR
jgi:hypothetical protein